MNSIHQSEAICNRLKEKNIYKKFSEKVIKHIVTILIAIYSVGYRGKTTNFASHSDNHRTTVAHFLNKGKWDESLLEQAIKDIVVNTIYKESQRSGKPVLCIIDDTIASKTKPASKAQNPIEAASFHFSHLKRKKDYGHQAVGVMLSCNGITLNYAIVMYDKTDSKIDIVKSAAEELPIPPNISYLLCDSWYVCGKIADAFLQKGFYTIGALKTNRVLYPNGVKINLRSFAERNAENDSHFHIVTVKGRKYHIYRYEGNLNGVDNAVVLISYPVGALGKSNALRAFISTNAALSDEQILNFYVQRWNIEVFFRDAKSKLALDKYQIRSSKGIKRFWIIASLAHLIACCESESFDFSDGYKIISNKIRCEQLDFIFDFVKAGGNKSDFLKMVA